MKIFLKLNFALLLIIISTNTVIAQNIPSLIWSTEFMLYQYQTTDTDNDPFHMFRGSFAIQNSTVYIENPERVIQALDLENGNLLWTSNSTGLVLGANSENLFIVPSLRRIDAIDVKTGEPKWRTLLEIEGIKDGLFVASEEMVFVPIDGYYIVVINSRTGEVLSTYEGHIFWNTDDLVLVSKPDFNARQNTLFALSTITGQKIWEIIIPDARPKPMICNNEYIVYYIDYYDAFEVVEPTSEITALAPHDGTVIWSTGLLPNMSMNPESVYVKDQLTMKTT
jgi:outer membrane protein assembly factor BamB